MSHPEGRPPEQEPFAVSDFLMKGVGYEKLEKTVARMEQGSEGEASNILKRQLRRLLGDDDTWFGTYRMFRFKGSVTKGETVANLTPAFMPQFPMITEGPPSGKKDPLVISNVIDFIEEHEGEGLPFYTFSTDAVFGDFRLEEIEDVVTRTTTPHGSAHAFSRKLHDPAQPEKVLMTTQFSDTTKLWIVGSNQPNRAHIDTTLALRAPPEIIEQVNGINDRWNAQYERMQKAGYINP